MTKKRANSKSSAKKNTHSKKSSAKTVSPRRGTVQIVLGTLFLLIVSIFGFSNMIAREFAIYYLVFSGITLFAYGIDKRAAINDDSRIPELVLQGFAVLGGWPGALIAQQIFRHKTIKVSFQIIFWITLILNCVVFYNLLITPEGTSLFNMML